MRGWSLIPLFVYVSIADGQALRDKGLEEIARRGIDEVYNLEFEKAEADFNEIVRQRPQNPAGYAFLAMTDWWRILIDLDNTQYDDRFHEMLDHVIELCDERL